MRKPIRFLNIKHIPPTCTFFLMLVRKASFPTLLLSFNKISFSFDHRGRHVMTFSLINSHSPGQRIGHVMFAGSVSVGASRKIAFLKNALFYFYQNRIGKEIQNLNL